MREYGNSDWRSGWLLYWPGCWPLVGAGAALGPGTSPDQRRGDHPRRGSHHEKRRTARPVDLGLLDSTPGSQLTASGRWTTEDCDSRFRVNSDAHTYQFEIDATGRIRVDLNSSDADSYLYLLDADGTRISENDDGGVGALDARIERELEAGVYLIEATTTAVASSGTGRLRSRGHAGRHLRARSPRRT